MGEFLVRSGSWHRVVVAGSEARAVELALTSVGDGDALDVVVRVTRLDECADATTEVPTADVLLALGGSDVVVAS